KVLIAGVPEWTGVGRRLSVWINADAIKPYEASLQKFCSIFPDTFYVSERARVYMDPEKEKKLAGRLLSAGFHSQMGYFRDDAPLYDLMLDENQQRELD